MTLHLVSYLQFKRLLLMASCWLLVFPPCASQTDVDSLSCIDSKHHKPRPSPEASLHGECAPWRGLSCCYENTSRAVHSGGLYNFNFSHCDKALSDECSRYFTREHCFFECSPYTSLWKIAVDMKTRKESVYHAPLCRSFCQRWFDACRHDLTCALNWKADFSWKTGTNKCKRKCQTFEQIFGNHERMCKKIWDDSYTVVDDSEHCLLPWFAPGSINPNRAVAQWRAQQLSSAHTQQGRMYAVLPPTLLLLVFLASGV